MAFDLLVIGAGMAGLAAAAEAARRGLSVCLLERMTVGSGQSGRAGGQFIPGFESDAQTLLRRYGTHKARQLYADSLAAAQHLHATVEAVQPGLLAPLGLVLARNDEDRAYLQHERRALAQLGARAVHLGERVREHVGSPHFTDGLLMPDTLHGCPARVCEALACLARQRGVALHENRPVHRLRRDSTSGWVAETGDGEVLACRVFLAGGDSILLANRWTAPTVQVRTWAVETGPLPPAVRASVLPSNACGYDVQELTMDFFCLRDDRLAFGGGDSVAARSHRGLAYLQQRLVQVFPQLESVPLERSWCGDIDVSATRMPVLRKRAGLWSACGYSGHGLVNAYAAGRHAVADMLGGSPEWERLAQLPALHFPAHHRVRSMAGNLGAWVLKAFSA